MEQTELHKKGNKNLLLPIMGLSRASSAWRFLTPRESALSSRAPLELDPQGRGGVVFWRRDLKSAPQKGGKTLPLKGSSLHITP